MATGEHGICRRCQRTIPLYARDLCKSCYTYIRLGVKAGKTTWAEMMDKGWASDRANQGRPSTAPSLEAMKAAAGLPEDNLAELGELAKELNFKGACKECEFSTEVPVELFRHRKETGHEYELGGTNGG